MMKSIKKFFAVTAVAATVFATTPATTAHAVGLNELFSKADAALKTVKSVDLKGNLTVAFDQNGTKVNFANVNFETELDLENVQGEGKVEIASQLSPSAQKQAFQLKDDTLSTQTGDKEWTKADYSAQRNQFKTALQNAMKEAYKDLTPEQEATLGQYFEIKEDGEDYVYALKQGIDGKKFYEDNKETFERVKEQALKQSEANGQTVSDQQKATYDKLFSAETMEKFFASNPKVEVRYNKSTYLVSKVTLDVNLKPADFLPAQSAQGAPGNIAVQANLEASDYNQPLELENH